MYLRTVQTLIASSLLAVAAHSQTMSLSPANPPSAPQASTRTWPTVGGAAVLPNFRFGTGETLPQLLFESKSGVIRGDCNLHKGGETRF